MGKSITLHPLFHELRDTIDIALIQVGINATESTRLAGVAATSIMERYKGSSLYIAKGLPQERALKKLAIRQAYKQGKSVAKLAADYRCTESWIRRILAEDTAESQPPS